MKLAVLGMLLVLCAPFAQDPPAPAPPKGGCLTVGARLEYPLHRSGTSFTITPLALPCPAPTAPAAAPAPDARNPPKDGCLRMEGRRLEYPIHRSGISSTSPSDLRFVAVRVSERRDD